MVLFAALLACGARPAPPKAEPPHVQHAPALEEEVLETRVPHGSLVFVFRVSPLANLVYQIDCLAERIHCSRGAFAEAWGDLGAEDKAKLAAWRAARAPYGADVELDNGALPKTAVPIPFLGLEYDKQLRVASFNARGGDDYAHLLSVLVRPSDARTFADVVAHFEPRFRAFWAAHGRRIADPPFRAFADLVAKRADLSDLIERVARFYGGDVPAGSEIVFDLIARPKSAATRATSAEHIGHHLVVEVLEGEKPERRMDVVLHELFHHFNASRPIAAKAALIERFAASEDPLAMVAYWLADESLATTFGNGLVSRLLTPDDFARTLAKENGFYNNRGIDRTAKALLPRADELLAGTMDGPGFVPAIVSAVHAAIGDSPAPIEYLHSFAAAYAPPFADAEKHLVEKAHANHTYDRALPSLEGARELADRGGLSAALFVSRADLAHLGDWPFDVRALDAEAKKKGAFVYALPRGRHAVTFFFVAEDAASMDRLVDAFVAREAPLKGAMRIE